MEEVSTTSSGKITLIVLCISAIFPLLALVSSLGFFDVPPGSVIRPMGWALLLFMLIGLGFILVLPCAIFAYYRERRLGLAFLAVILSLTPLPLGLLLERFAEYIVGFTLAK